LWHVSVSLAIIGLTIKSKVKVKVNYPITGLDRPLGLQEVEAVRISIQSAHEVCHPSAPAAFTPQEISPVPQDHVAAGRIEQF